MLFFFLILFGLVIGSFISCLTYRISNHKPIFALRSYCPACNTKLRIGDLIPLLSWILSKAKCRYCAKPISIRYPTIEIISAIITIIIYIKFQHFPSLFILYTLITYCLLVISIIDLEHYVIPDLAVLIILLASLSLLWINNEDLIQRITLAVGITILLYGLRILITFITGKESLGIGDIKLFFVCFLLMSKYQIPLFFIISGSVGILIHILQKLAKSKNNLIPFGPAIAAGFYICLLIN